MMTALQQLVLCTLVLLVVVLESSSVQAARAANNLRSQQRQQQQEEGTNPISNRQQNLRSLETDLQQQQEQLQQHHQDSKLQLGGQQQEQQSQSEAASFLPFGGVIWNQLTPFVNDQIDGLRPIMQSWIFEKMSNYELVESSKKSTKVLFKDKETVEGFCTSSASVTYGFSKLRGMDNITINNITSVIDTNYIEFPSWWNLWRNPSASWGGDWWFNGTFPHIEMETTFTLDATLCGVPLQQSLNGVLTILDSTVAGTVAFEGETAFPIGFGVDGKSLISVDVSTQVSPIARNAFVNLGSATLDFNIEGNVVNTVASTQTIEKAVLDDMARDVPPFILNLLNTVLEPVSPLEVVDTRNNNANSLAPADNEDSLVNDIGKL